MAGVTDGTAAAYLIDEKYMDPDYYDAARITGTTRSLRGWNNDVTRYGLDVPKFRTRPALYDRLTVRLGPR